jgi:uncharacterized membrane protein YhhN
VAGVCSVADWWAVATQDRRWLEYVCKPAAALAFLATAIAVEPVHADTRVWFCVALGLCVVGDVFLMLPRDAFVPGLASFLVAQLSFAVGFCLEIDDERRLAIGIVVVAVAAAPLATRFVRALVRTRQRPLVVPVITYIVAIGMMCATAIGVGSGFGVAGAALFFVSDALIAETRFVRWRAWGPLTVMVSYHLALAGLVFSLVT